MKLIIDINDNEYIGIKEHPDNVTSYPVTIHLYDAVRNSTPLDDLRNEMMHDIYMMGVNMADEYHGCWVRFENIEQAVDKYLGKEQSE